MAVDVVGVQETPEWVQTTWCLTFELEGVAKPACVAEVLMRHYF